MPRTSIVSVSIDATLDQVLRLFLDHQYSRMPVYEKQPENIVGIVHFKDLIQVWEERRGWVGTEASGPAIPSAPHSSQAAGHTGDQIAQPTG